MTVELRDGQIARLHGVLRHRGRSARVSAVREARAQPLPTVRRSPYFERTLAAGASDFMVYN